MASQQAKLDYIKEKLEEEKAMEACQAHYDSAVLGHQLKWVGSGEVVQEKTHIFNGTKRFSESEVDQEVDNRESGHLNSAGPR